MEILEDGNYICNALLLSSKRINNKINFIDLLTLSIIIAPQLSQKLDLIEELVAYVANEVLGTTKIKYGENEIDLTPPWDRKTMLGAVEEATGNDKMVVESLLPAFGSFKDYFPNPESLI